MNRILILSVRGRRRELANSCLFELEDSVASFDDADVVPVPVYHDDLRVRVGRKAQQALRLVVGKRAARRPPPPFPHPIRLAHDYDLIFAVLDTVWDHTLVHLVQDWRKRATRVACYVAELWDEPFEDWRFGAEHLGDLDHVFVSTYHDVERLAAATGVACSYLAPGVDALRFAPRSPSQPRPVHVSYLGRRSPVTHESLRRAAADRGWYYSYDLPGRVEVTDPRAHREWLAELLRNSRYAITNYARANEPELARNRRELGYRFFESSAAGTVMLGVPPDVPPFQEQFSWSDAVIPMPFDSPDIGDRLDELDRQPERIETARRRNVAGSLTCHDWVYRWSAVLETLGLSSNSRMWDRQERLTTAATRWQL